ncbi:MAG: lipoyl synthase [Thermodesulfobacteriota bacterium]
MAKRLPPWVRSRLPSAEDQAQISSWTYQRGLATVCQEARCPNRGDCFHRRTATFLILGPRCTRNCRFCAVEHGTPAPVALDEPLRVASSVKALGLKFAVITSVTRDDLPDGGAKVFAETIEAIRRECPGTGIEVLVPDFQGSEDALRVVVGASPDVLNHNLETVPRLYPQLRQGASYERSLELLRRVRTWAPRMWTKSGIMVGVGETPDEILGLVRDLVSVGCQVLTIGQYLQPSMLHHPVERYLHPDEFEELKALAMAQGMAKVVAGPLVRSSYHAGETINDLA